MAIINGKETALGPLFDRLFVCWFSHIQNDTHSIFVVISHNTLMGISRITIDKTVSFGRKLGAFKIFEWIQGGDSFLKIRTSCGIHKLFCFRSNCRQYFLSILIS
jgi:hypothetical protein